MVQMAFFLRFMPQLQRTRPQLISQLEEQAESFAELAGGKISKDSNVLQTIFNTDSTGFWVNMLLLIENFRQITLASATDLYGYSLLFMGSQDRINEPLCRYLANRGGGGVFLDSQAAFALRPYINLEEQNEIPSKYKKNDEELFFKMIDTKIFIPMSMPELTLNGISVLLGAAEKNQAAPAAALLSGKFLQGRRDDIYRQIHSISINDNQGGIPPLIMRFTNGTLNALTDLNLNWLYDAPGSLKTKEMILSEREFLFRQRMKHRPSPFALRTAEHYFSLLIDCYINAARQLNSSPVLIIENVHIAGHEVRQIVVDVLCEQTGILIYGICPVEIETVTLGLWKKLFEKLIKVNPNSQYKIKTPELPDDLWEIGYIFLLIGKYFPAEIYIPLLIQEGITASVINRAIALLNAMKIIDTLQDPRPWHKDFMAKAEDALGEKKEKCMVLICNCLLRMAEQKKIDPCLNLLKEITELGCSGSINDELILRSISNELNDIDSNFIENLLDFFEKANSFGSERILVIRYLIKTMAALYSGNAVSIRNAFVSPSVHSSAFPSLHAQLMLNLSLYHLGLRNNDAALKTLKDAGILCHKTGGCCLTQYYRLYALVSLSFKRINETVDYLNFAMENAEKTGVNYDMGISAYYAAAVQFLYGNLSNANTLVQTARKKFLSAGSADWADRCSFLEGRLACEAGAYREAAEIFEKISANPMDGMPPEKKDLIAIWLYRAKSYYEKDAVPLPESKLPDMHLVQLETLCLAEDYSKAAELSAWVSGSNPGASFFHIEQASWFSGFDQCELLFFSWNNLWDRLISAYHSLAICHLSSTDGEKAIRAMQDIIRNSEYRELDTYDAFFHYVLFRILQHCGASQVDINTAISIANKRLQSRAGRIDDDETRKQFLGKPYWNKAIDQAARDFKLV